jgi:hypothetical protein
MTDWSLPELFAELHKGIERSLETARAAFGHPGVKGDATEAVWAGLLEKYLPSRYRVDTGHVVDSNGTFSEQIDLIVLDRQYTPFIFTFENQSVIPAEGVYAVFEAKQTINANLVAYAQKKVASVRRLHRTSLPVVHAGGVIDKPKAPPHILGGVLALESEWSPPLGEALSKALAVNDQAALLDFGCVAARGMFERGQDGRYRVLEDRPTTRFLLELMARLQISGTVPVIDIRAYANWMDKA